ncbi:MAG: metallopeptidase family protein [Acidimicrobiia bacterium]
MDISTFEQEVDTVLGALPMWVTDQMENVSVVVDARPTRAQDPQDDGLLGVYEGIPLNERGNDYFGVSPDRIVIFYEPHVALRLDDATLRQEIRKTVLHEVGHHIGLTEDRLHELGWG